MDSCDWLKTKVSGKVSAFGSLPTTNKIFMNISPRDGVYCSKRHLDAGLRIILDCACAVHSIYFWPLGLQFQGQVSTKKNIIIKNKFKS